VEEEEPMLLTRPLQSTRRLTSAQDDGGPGILALGLSPLALSAGPLSSKDPAARSEGLFGAPGSAAARRGSGSTQSQSAAGVLR